MEQALGHITHAQNIRANAPKDSPIVPHWIPVSYEVSGSASRLPLYNSNWTVRAGWRARRALRSLLRTQPIDGMFINTQVPAVLIPDWVRHYPTVISLDATPLQYDQLGEFYHHQRGPDLVEAAKLRLTRDVLQQARSLVTWSAWTKESLVKDYGIQAEKIVVIPPGVNPAQWRQAAADSVPPSGALRILFVGGDLWRKGGQSLLDAFHDLRSAGQGQQIELHLVTKTPIPPADGVIVYNDIQPNTPRLMQLYQQAALFVLPTSADCLPMALAEASAAGLPVISTTVAGIPEIIAQGESGLLVPPGDRQALCAAMQTLVADADLRQRMGKRGQQIVESRFNVHTNTSRLFQTIQAAAMPEARHG
jgi:glycosyltransferase involved in cell wall biosynthesis